MVKTPFNTLQMTVSTLQMTVNVDRGKGDGFVHVLDESHEKWATGTQDNHNYI